MDHKAQKPPTTDVNDPGRSSTSDDAAQAIAGEDKPLEDEVTNEAGPSGAISLPGALPEVFKCAKSKTPGLSKSEQNLRHVVTAKEVANALNAINITSNKNKELRIPIPETEQSLDTVDPAAFVELRKFMESCFKINTSASNRMSEVVAHGGVSNVQNMQNVQTPIILPNVIQNIPNSSCPKDVVLDSQTVIELSNIETAPLVESSIPIPNTHMPSNIEPKLSKTEKKKVSKKTSNTDPKVDFPVATRDSMSSIGSNVCRICMTRGKERLISPCNCKGSLANVHLSCLERWLNQVGRNHCELCGFSYPAIRTPRYTVLQALRLWFGNPRNRSHLQSDCLIFWLLSTVTAGLLAVCIVGTQYFVIEGNKFGKHDAGIRKGEGISHRITETAMDFFMAIVLCGYSVTVYLLWKDHYVMWNRWRRANVNVRLLLSPDTNPVPFVPDPRYNIV